VGHIAELLQMATRDVTPLQKRLDQVARRLLWACLGIVVLIFALGLLRSSAYFELFLGAVSLAVAAIPEGLPTVVTIALALGMQRMARRNALVRRLPAVETLGCAQVICSDKTGTLTVGEMTARKLIASHCIYSISGEGYATEGTFFVDSAECTVAEDPLLSTLLCAAAACNDAELIQRDQRPSVVGDPTEGALLVVAAKGGVTREHLESELPRLHTIPFDSDRKRMTVLRRREGQPWAFVKGAPEVILTRCTHIHTERGVKRLTASDRARMTEASAFMANEALRVLAFAERRIENFSLSVEVPMSDDSIEQGLVLLGLIGLQDPPPGRSARGDQTVQTCRYPYCDDYW
jgi:Ca2+-transporting ATPase